MWKQCSNKFFFVFNNNTKRKRGIIIRKQINNQTINYSTSSIIINQEKIKEQTTLTPTSKMLNRIRLWKEEDGISFINNKKESETTTPFSLLLKKMPNKAIVANQFLIARFENKLYELNEPIPSSVDLNAFQTQVEYLNFSNPEARQVFWHSTSHLLGWVLESVRRIK